MATKTKARRKKCKPGYTWGEIKSEEKDPTAGKGGKEKKLTGGKPKMGCIKIEKGKGLETYPTGREKSHSKLKGESGWKD